MDTFLQTITSFSNISYLTFLLLTIILFYVFNRSVLFLLLASIFFYATFSIEYCLLLLILCLINYITGAVLAEHRNKIILILGIALNIGVLIVFRYTNFILQNLRDIHLITQPDVAISILQPLGISFFTFEFLHYLIDVSRGNKPIKNFIKFLLFPFFFPTQIAGPIKRYEKFLPQLKKKRVDISMIQEGILLIIKGLFKKLVLADNLALFVAPGFTGDANAWTTILAAYAFTFQIFFDFSGYTDIGRGSALLLGIKIPENFLQPYLATNMKEFWQRWHVTLMKWFTDYVYIPLGGNRVPKARWIINVIIVFILSGLWHGTAWHFVLWGAYNGILVILSGSFQPLKMIPHRRLKRIMSILITFHLVVIGWIIFRASDAKIALKMIKSILHFQINTIQITDSLFFIIVLLSLSIWYQIIIRQLRPASKGAYIFRYLSYGIAIVLIILHLANQPAQFIYFQF